MPPPLEREAAMQQVQTPYEIDDVTLINRLFPPDPTQQGEERPAEHLTEAEVEEIFKREEAAIQPLLRKMRRERFFEIAEMVLCFCVLCGAYAGIIWQCITYPHTLIFLYTKAIPASIATTLDLSTRTLAPVTLTRSATSATSGTGHQAARVATGTLTFYNGQSQSISVPSGSVFTGRDGETIATTQDAVIPAADSSTSPPTYGSTTVYAHAVRPGANGNIAAFDMSGSCCAPSVIVKNLAPFHNGQDARTFRAVAQQDVQTLIQTVSDHLTQAFPSAFPLQPGEAAIPTHCTTKATTTHQVGAEAQTVTLTIAKTCSAVAYNQSELTRAAATAFTKTRPGATYHIVGNIQTTVKSVSPLTVTLSGTWAYTFSQSYQDYLAEHIQGDNPEKARVYLLKTGVIFYASVPNTLASADYINFFVLVS